jgi:hypothetical protein
MSKNAPPAISLGQFLEQVLLSRDPFYTSPKAISEAKESLQDIWDKRPAQLKNKGHDPLAFVLGWHCKGLSLYQDKECSRELYVENRAKAASSLDIESYFLVQELVAYIQENNIPAPSFVENEYAHLLHSGQLTFEEWAKTVDTCSVGVKYSRENPTRWEAMADELRHEGEGEWAPDTLRRMYYLFEDTRNLENSLHDDSNSGRRSEILNQIERKRRELKALEERKVFVPRHHFDGMGANQAEQVVSEMREENYEDSVIATILRRNMDLTAVDTFVAMYPDQNRCNSTMEKRIKGLLEKAPPICSE